MSFKGSSAYKSAQRVLLYLSSLVPNSFKPSEYFVYKYREHQLWSQYRPVSAAELKSWAGKLFNFSESEFCVLVYSNENTCISLIGSHED